MRRLLPTEPPPLLLGLALLPALLAPLACGKTDPGADSGAADGGAADGGVSDGGTDGGGDGGAADGGGDGGGSADGGTGDGGGSADGGAEDGGSEALGPVVILMVGDGMGFEHVRGGGLYAHGAEGSLYMESLPVQGRLQTASLSGLTDSAAAATTMATGVKTWNAVLGLDPHGDPVPDVADHARERGMRVGIVTSDKLTGATPGAFMVDVDSRYDADAVTDAIVASPPDLMLGGGRAALADPLSKAGVQVVDDLALADLSDLPLAGLFADAELPYLADSGGHSTTPPLSTLASTALAALQDHPQGFFLLVEGARIDHASHGNREDRVYAEVGGFDAAVQAVDAWILAHPERDVTLLVTADHECGGLQLLETGTAAGVVPETRWVWYDHTNADVPVWGRGRHAEVLHEQRVHNSYVHAVLEAALLGADSVEPPALPRLVDGDTADLGAVVAVQDHASSFGEGYTQLDALRLTADADGLWVGVDGVVDGGANALLVLLDLDYGEATGVGRDGIALADGDGELDRVLTAVQVAPGLDGLGFDAAVGSLRGTYARIEHLTERAGLRGFVEPWGLTTDLWWLDAAVNFDSGNLALGGSPAPDAGPMGETEGGAEVWVPWSSLYPTGLPAEGQRIAVAVLVVNDDGSLISNQVLPALDSAEDPGASLEVVRVAVLEVDGDGVAVGVATVEE